MSNIAWEVKKMANKEEEDHQDPIHSKGEKTKKLCTNHKGEEEEESWDLHLLIKVITSIAPDNIIII